MSTVSMYLQVSVLDLALEDVVVGKALGWGGGAPRGRGMGRRALRAG